MISSVIHVRKSVLFHNKDIWVKKENKDFDVAMGCYGGAEVCELVGLYILDSLCKEFGKGNLGLYRDDGLACFQQYSWNKIRKNKEENM